jgi:hypothetical protein
LVELFAEKYEEVCRKTGVPLAPFCPNRDKAFPPGDSGTVLGIRFNSNSMTWNISKEKGECFRAEIRKFTSAKTCNLKSTQKLHGKISDLAQMLDFGKGFRFNLVALLGKFKGDEETRKLIPRGLKIDLLFWEKCSLAAEEGLPIPEPREAPPLVSVRFISDAAGSSSRNLDKLGENDDLDQGKGVASIGYDHKGVWAISRLRWPQGLLAGKKNLQGKVFGHKTAMLEAVGLLLPSLSVPWAMKNKQVILEVDNISFVYSWDKRYCKNDPEASVLIRCLHVIEAFLECVIHVVHTGRLSTEHASLADRLLRESTTTTDDRHLLKKLKQAP